MTYFYGQEAEQFAFFRIPKMLISDKRFAGIKCEAKLLYGMMLDRMELSTKNLWLDKHNRVYIYYTIESIMSDLGCGHEKAGKLLAELERAGLIERVRQGMGKPDRIYVGKFTDICFSDVLTSDNQRQARLSIS